MSPKPDASDADADAPANPDGVTAAPVPAALEPDTNGGFTLELSGVAQGRVMLAILLVLFATAALWLTRAVTIPVAAGVLTALLCRPLVTRLTAWGLWQNLSASIVVLGLAVVFVIGMATAIVPALEWVDNAPRHLATIEQKLRDVQGPMHKFTQVGEHLRRMTEGDEYVQKVAVQEDGYPLLNQVLAIVGGLVIMLVLAFFLLCYWDDFLLNLVRQVPTLTQRKGLVAAVHDAEREVSHYLIVRTVINVGLGLASWAAFAGLDALDGVSMPSALLWATVGGVLNFVPYLGAFVAFVLIAIASLIANETLAAASYAPLAFAVLTTVEGFIVSPLAFGRGLKMNPVVVLVGLVFWGWLWGIPGALMAVPILVCIRIVCERVGPLKPISALMGAPSDDPLAESVGVEGEAGGGASAATA